MLSSAPNVTLLKAPATNSTNTRIALLRVIATFIVILGHSIIIYSPDWSEIYGYHPAYESHFLHQLKGVINSFQMELFFSISGFCFLYTMRRRTNFPAFVKGKFIRLLIPFIFIAILWMIPLRLIAHYKAYEGADIPAIIYNALTVNDAGHLWFLPVLFCIMGIAYFVMPLIKKNTALPFAIAVAVYIGSYLAPNFITRQTCHYFLYFTIGFYLNHLNIFNINNSTKIKITGLIVAFFTILFALRAICEAPVGAIIRVSTPAAIILIAYSLARDTKSTVLEYLDKNSFGLYLFHSPVLYVGMHYIAHLPPPIYITTQLIGSVLISLMMCHILKRARLGFLIGMKNGR